MVTRLGPAAVMLIALAAGAAQANTLTFSGTNKAANQVDYFYFNVESPGTVTGATFSVDFDPILAIWKPAGSDWSLLDQNDDASGANGSSNDLDAGLTLTLLPVGTYLATVSDYANFANGPLLSNGFTGDGFFGDADYPYELRIASEDGTVSAIPLPAAVWLFGSALAGLGLFRRRTGN